MNLLPCSTQRSTGAKPVIPMDGLPRKPSKAPQLLILKTMEQQMHVVELMLFE